MQCCQSRWYAALGLQPVRAAAATSETNPISILRERRLINLSNGRDDDSRKPKQDSRELDGSRNVSVFDLDFVIDRIELVEEIGTERESKNADNGPPDHTKRFNCVSRDFVHAESSPFGR